MKKFLTPLWLTAALALSACGTAAGALDPQASAPSHCPVTQLEEDPRAIGPLYGSEDGLQVFITGEGVWSSLPGDAEGLGQKVFWKYPGYNVTEDYTPALTVTGEQLDGDGYFFEPGPATNAFAADLLGDAILSGVRIPHAGCWQLTGEYRGSQLSFVVWVGD